MVPGVNALQIVDRLHLTQPGDVIKIDGENFNDLKPVEVAKVGITFQKSDDQLFNPTVQREVEWSVAPGHG